MNRTLIADAPKLIGETIKVDGWISSCRDHGKIIFIDLRDRSGSIQAVGSKGMEGVDSLRPEWVVEIVGLVKSRPENMVNEDLETGRIEMEINEITVLSKAETPPFDLRESGSDISEESRLKYRYLDLRRPRMQRNLTVRHKVFQLLRRLLSDQGFREIDTPVLARSTPEGARDFVVPSRHYPGTFYALPQSPQQYKQLLMVAGLERYFQIARCFRDEDFRSDRQAEFTQLDIELSFVDQKEILEMMENMFKEVVETVFSDKKIKEFPFPRLTYDEAMKLYQSDRPDLRSDKNDNKELAFAFVIDFPMFEKPADQIGWTSVHHPFTRPQTDNLDEIKNNPGQIKAFQYDLVLNGAEIGGGSLRTYKSEMLQTIFEVLGHDEKTIKDNFGHLLEAFSFGVPPHGGIAIGLDRFLSIMLDEKNIREVIPFPKTEGGKELMTGSPAGITHEQLRELNLSLKNTENK